MDLQDKEPLKEPLVQTSVRVMTLNRSAKRRYIMGMRFYYVGNSSMSTGNRNSSLQGTKARRAEVCLPCELVPS